MVATLHHVPKTISSPIMQTLLELPDVVPDKVVIKTLTFPELKQAPHLAINPMGTSPAFYDGDMSMWESGAVLTWILEQYDVQHTLHPAPGQNGRAKFLQLQQYIVATVYPFIATAYLHTLKEEQDEDYMASAKAKWRDLMAPILVEWLGDGPYFLGDTISAVDLLVCKPLTNVKSLGMLEETPTLQALYERVSSRPTFPLAYAMEPIATTATNGNRTEKRSLLLVPGNENK